MTFDATEQKCSFRDRKRKFTTANKIKIENQLRLQINYTDVCDIRGSECVTPPQAAQFQGSRIPSSISARDVNASTIEHTPRAPNEVKILNQYIYMIYLIYLTNLYLVLQLKTDAA